jgi:hypothetical protein
MVAGTNTKSSSPVTDISFIRIAEVTGAKITPTQVTRNDTGDTLFLIYNAPRHFPDKSADTFIVTTVRSEEYVSYKRRGKRHFLQSIQWILPF